MSIEEENLELWRLVEKTDPRYTKKVNTRGGFTAVDAQWQVRQATGLWGPMGGKWGLCGGFDDELPLPVEHEFIRVPTATDPIAGIPYQGPIDVVVLVARGMLYYPGEHGTNHIPLSTNIRCDPRDDFAKKVETDMLTKGLSKLGFAADVFMGLFDDNKYVQGRLEEVLVTEEWTEDRTEFCVTLNALGFNYEDICLWQESRDKPRPSAMRRGVRGVLLDWLSDRDNRDRVKHDIDGIHTTLEEM